MRQHELMMTTIKKTWEEICHEKNIIHPESIKISLIEKKYGFYVHVHGEGEETSKYS